MNFVPPEASSQVVWVGPSRGNAYEAILGALRRRGMPINLCPSLGTLMHSLNLGEHPVVVACEEQKRRRALDVVAILGKAASRVPIVVLAEDTDFGDYYYLMNHGVLGYFQVNEDPEQISRAIARTALVE